MNNRAYVGSRLRQLRSERGLSQVALAQTLRISASYLNQIEHDARPLTASVLARITEAFGVDGGFFDSQDDVRLVAELREALLDDDIEAAPTTADPQEIAAMVSAHPDMAQAMVNLHRRYRIAIDQLAAATDERSDRAMRGSITAPHEEVRDYFYQRRNYIHALDVAAEELNARMRMHSGDVRREIADRLERVHGVTIAPRVDLGDYLLHRFDPATRRLEVSAALSAGQRAFKLAAELALVEFDDLLTELVEEANFTNDEAQALAKTGLANYFAAAVLLPYTLRHRTPLGVLRGLLRDHLPPTLDAAAPEPPWRTVVVRPRRPCGKHVETPVRHRISLLVERRHMPTVECLRDVRLPRKDHHANRRNARRP